MRERGTRVSRGFGFLTFEFAPSAASARVYMNAAVLHGFGNNPICVDFSNREKEAQHEQARLLHHLRPPLTSIRTVAAVLQLENVPIGILIHLPVD